MALKWTTTDQASANHGVKALVYGGAGVGKTVLCSTCPAPVILSAEAGLLSLRKHQIPVIQILNVNDLSEAYAWAVGSAEAQQFQTICLDSISEIGEQILANYKGIVKDPRQAYGELIDKMSQLIRFFRDLPGKHVYMSAKMEPMKDEMSGVVKYGPAMPGAKLGPQVPFFFDEVFHLGIGQNPQTKEMYRYLQTQPDFQHTAKDRSGVLQPAEPPHLGHIFNRIVAG